MISEEAISSLFQCPYQQCQLHEWLVLFITTSHRLPISIANQKPRQELMIRIAIQETL